MGRLGLGLLVGLIVMVALPAGASAVVVQTATGQRYGVFLRPGESVSALPDARVPKTGRVTSANGNVDYNGGPVLHSSAPYLIFWDPSSEITARSQTVLKQYLTDAAADSGKGTDVFSVLSQYTDSTPGFAQYKQTFSGSQALVDTRAYPATTGACTNNTGPSDPHCVTDGQIQTELTRFIGATSLPTGTGANAPIYFLITPADLNICSSGLGCAADGDFCAYHSNFTDGASQVLYASVPFMVWTVNSTKGCQVDGTAAYQSPNSDQADNIADDLSHELDETITDPLGTAWYDDSSGNEVADNCESYGANDPANGTSPNAYEPILGGSESSGTLYDQVINGHQYYTQTVWSNYSVGCEAQAVTPRFVDSVHGTVVSLDPTASTQSTGSIASFSWDFGDGSNASGTGSPAVISHTYAVPATYTVTLTLVDSTGNTTTISRSVDEPPTASLTGPASGVAATAVTFDASGSSDPDNSIVGYGWSFGDGTTNSAGPATSHTYSAPGTYTVTLTVTNSSGLQSMTSHQITIATLPTASFTGPPSGVAGTTVTFDGSGSSDSGGSIVGYGWSFGDGTTSATGPTTSHTYSAPGTYTVTLTVTDSGGQQSTTSHRITIGNPPPAPPSGPTPGLGKVKVSGNTAAVTVTCKGAGACSVILQLSVIETAAHGNVIAVTAAKRTKKTTVVLSKVSVSLSGGQTKTVHVSLGQAGRRLLVKFHQLEVKLAVLSGGKTVSHTTVTFKAPPKKR